MTRVIKVGGRPQGDPSFVAAIAAAHRSEVASIVVVHGGGPEVSALQQVHGVSPQFHGGRRITSALDLELIRMALSGSANKRLVSSLVGAGVEAVGLSGEDAGLLIAEPIDIERYGFVGIPTTVRTTLLQHLLGGGFLPVISPVARAANTSGGATLNVNGDDAAAAIAVALGAEELLLVSDVEGVLVDALPLSWLDEEGIKRLIDRGIATGGMGAKLEAALAALDGGVDRVRISDIAAIADADRGTVLTRAGSVYA